MSVTLGDPCHNLSALLVLVVLPWYIVPTFSLRRRRINNKKWNDQVIGCICICTEMLRTLFSKVVAVFRIPTSNI